MASFVLVTFNNFHQISAQTVANWEQVIHDTAQEAVARARANAPVLTSCLQESIHAVTDQANGYPAAAAAAQSLRPPGYTGDQFGEAHIFPEVAPPHPLSAIVAACVGHGAIKEFGGVRSPAKPFFVSAVEGLAADFERDMRAAITP